MSGATSSLLSKPVRRKRASFVLTSLIDVIFLLVIFFMVSSQIVPYSLIPLGAVSSRSQPTDASAQPAAIAPLAVRILNGGVSIGGGRIAMADLDAAFMRLKADGIETLILLPGAGSTVQDVVSVLESSKAAAFADMTIVNRDVMSP